MNIKQRVERDLKESISGKKAVFLFAGDKASTLLMDIVDDMNVHTIFVDTGYHFEEIMDYVKSLAEKVEIINNSGISENCTVDMYKCCSQSKAEVLKKYLTDNNAGCLIVPFMDEDKIYGIEDSYLNGIDDVEIIRPLANFTESDIWIGIKEYRLQFSIIYNKGYKVIDCKRCTTRFGRKKQSEEHKEREFDRETEEKLKSLGYM